MTVVSAVCGTFWGCLYAYQTLIAGVLAVGAAAVTAGVIWYAAHLPVKAQERREEALTERRRVYGFIALSAELWALQVSIGHVRGSIGGLEPPSPIDLSLKAPAIIGDWEATSLLPPDLMRRCQALAVSVLHYNRSISNIARDDEWRDAEQQLDHIWKLAHDLRQEVEKLLEADEG